VEYTYLPSEEASFRLDVRTADNGWIIQAAGELDLATAPELEREMRRAEASDATRIVLDLHDVTFIDSTGIRLLVQAEGRNRSTPGRLRLMPANGQVAQILELTGLSERLPFLD
jgi:anti-sigma B factor antagonist